MIMPWGKHKGEFIDQLPSGYLKWLAENCENDEIASEADDEYRWRSLNQEHWEE